VGENVVNANKAALVKYWDPRFFTTARIYQKSIYYEASIGSVIPDGVQERSLSEGLASGKMLEIKGILNDLVFYPR
jgi:homoserine dehydrogenase